MGGRFSRLAAVLLVWVGLGAGCRPGAPAQVEVPADSAAGEVAFRFAGAGGAAMVVPVYINGHGPFDFAIDTGATFTCVDHGLAERLHLSDSGSVSGLGANVESSGRIRLLRVDSVRVGAASARRLMACEVDLGHAGQLGVDIQGLLGLNFLKSFRVTLDFKRNVLQLQKPGGGV